MKFHFYHTGCDSNDCLLSPVDLNPEIENCALRDAGDISTESSPFFELEE